MANVLTVYRYLFVYIKVLMGIWSVYQLGRRYTCHTAGLKLVCIYTETAQYVQYKLKALNCELWIVSWAMKINDIVLTLF